MKSQRVRMSIDEYLQMQQPFGYKVEYYNGEAVFEPRELAVDARLTLSPRPTAAPWSFTAVSPVHSETMKTAFFNKATAPHAPVTPNQPAPVLPCH